MIKRIILIFITLLILLIGASGFYIFKSMKPLVSTTQGNNTSFTVKEGESLYSTLDRLENNELIRDAWIYKIYNKFVRNLNVKKGFYSLNPADSGLEILAILEEGKQELIRVTIPEGMRTSQIAQILEEKGITSSKSFLSAVNNREIIQGLKIPADSADGYLFPDTYYFQKDFPPDQILEHMIETYYRNLESIFPFYKDLSDEKLQEKLILASIIEKEYRVAEEAPLIASVFNNRMKIGMPLQSCATVIYVITEEQGKEHPDRVLFRDLEIQSEFNTYINKTLPPSPISNPGSTALSAAFNPTQSDYLFFVVKDSAIGTHRFTSNLSDHNTARQTYIQGFRSK